MIPETRDRGFVDVGSCDEGAREEPTGALNPLEGTTHQHQNNNSSNHHHDISQHSHHPLDNNSDSTNALFPQQQHLQPHRHDLNGLPSSADSNNITGSDLHLLTHSTLTSLHSHHHQPPLHHPEQQHHHHHQQYQQHQALQQQELHIHNLNHQAQQQAQNPFSYHHERHTTGDDENDSIVEANTALQHEVAVVDVGGLHQHTHPTDITPVSEHHNPNHHIVPSRLLHQEHGHQLSIGMVYHPHHYSQQYQQDTQQLQQPQQHRNQEQEDQSQSGDPTQGMASSMFPPQNPPLPLPPRVYQQNLNINSNVTSTKRSNTGTKNDKKAVNITSKVDKKRHHRQQGITINSGTATGRGSLGAASAKKPRRRRYDNNFKAEVLSHLKGPDTKLTDVARRYGIPENTLREWTKANAARAIQDARSKNTGQLKANMYDPMKRLTETLMVFFEHNRRQPEHLRQSITTKLIVAKGLEARQNLLERHAANPFLEAKEKKALENFKGSDSWAKKFARRRDLKMTGARIKELSEEDVNQFHQSLKQMSNRVKQAGPSYEDAAALIRQAAEKLLLASIIHSTASHRLMGNIAVSNGHNDRKINRTSKSKSQLEVQHHQREATVRTSKLQADLSVQNHILRDAINVTSLSSDQHPSPS